MKRKTLLIATLLGWTLISVRSQNIAVNTDGTAAESPLLLDVKGTNSIVTNGTQNIFQIKSFDASTAALKLRLGLSTGASLYGTIDVYDANSSTARGLVLQQNGGNLLIKTVTPLADMTLNGSFTSTSVSGSSLHPGIWMNASLLGAAGGCYGILSRGTLNAVANNDELIPFITSIGTVTPGAFTGVNFYGAKLDGSTWSKSGGTISTATGLYVLAPTFGTSNYAGIFTGGNVGVGMMAPSWLVDAKKDQNGYTLYGIRNSTAGTGALSGMIMYNDNAASAGIIGLTSTAWNLAGAYPTLGQNKVFIDANTSMNGIVLNTEGAQPLFFATNMAERMRVDGAGNVGIGTTTPGTITGWAQPANMRVLEVSGDGTTAGTFTDGTIILSNNRATATVADQAGSLCFGHKNNAGNFLSVIATNLTGAGGANGFGGELRFYTKADNVAGHQQRMVIDNAGKVGIGTGAPGYRLHVLNTDPSIIVNSFSQFQPTLAANQPTNLHASWNEFYAGSAFNFNCALYGAVNRVTVMSTQAGTVSTTMGSTNDLWYYGSGNLSTAYGAQNVINNATALGGIVSTAYGMYSQLLNLGNGSITTGYGMYTGPIQATNKWSLYVSDATAPSYFAGKVGIANAAPTYPLDVTGNMRVTGDIYFGSWGNWLSTILGNMNCGGCYSDIRFKKNITSLNSSLDNVLKLQGVNYLWKTKEFPDKHFTDDKQIGFIAQELEKIYPELVKTDKDGYKMVDYSHLTPILVEAIKEQQKQIDELNKKVDQMQSQISNSPAKTNENRFDKK